MNRRVASDRFVGRDEEARAGRLVIDALLANDPAHRVPLLLVAGEAGIGKSRLLDELVDHARARAVPTVCGRCLEHGGEIRPLSAISEIVAELVPVAAELGLSIHPELMPLVDGSADAEPTVLSRWPARLDGQLQALLRDISARRAVIVAIEDLHWADQTTRALLISLLRARGLDDVLMIGTYRSDELHRRHPLVQFLAETERTVRCERVELAPLPDDAVRELATAIQGDQAGGPTGRDLCRRSGGNPFFVEEILAAGRAGDRLPEGVRHVVLARSQGLGGDAVRCIQAASTLAAPVDRLVLHATSGLAPASHQAAIDELCRERFLVEEPEGFRFRHDLVREVFLDELLPGERTTLFVLAAAALERHQPRRLGEIARLHYAGGQLGEALRASMAAASGAEAIGAMAEASESYGRALDIWQSVDRPAELASCSHLELLRRAARAADLSRHFDRAVELGRLAAAAAADGDPIVEGATLFELAQYTWNAGTPGLDEVIDRALRVLPSDPPSVERARMEIRRANRLRLRGESAEAAVLLQRAVDTARLVGDRGVEADAQSTLGYERAVFGDEAALGQVYDALALATAAEAGEVATKILVNLTNTLVFMGRYEEAARLGIDGVSIAERYGLMALHGILLQGNGLEALEPLGRWDEAQTIVEDIVRRHGGDSVHQWASALVGWGQIEIHRGAYDRAAPLYRRGFELRSSGYYSGDLGQLGAGLIELAAAGAVPTVTVDVVDGWFASLPADEAAWAARLAAVAAKHLVPPTSSPDHRAVAGRVEGWIDHIRRVADDAYQPVPAVLDVWVEQARAELDAARGDRSPEAWFHLASAWGELGCPYFAAHASYRQADAVLTTGGGRAAEERAVAARLLGEALRVAERLGADPLRHDVLDLAARARLRLDDGPPTTAPEPSAPLPFGLTTREVEVLRLLVEGRSNGEIGTQLFISRKTASVHVSNILRKLGATNRIEATAIARRHQV